MTSILKRYRIAEICIAFFVLLILSGYWFLVGKVQICIFRLFTGLPCPGCGLTRAGIALLNGDIVSSFRFHPFLLPVLFCLLVIACTRFPRFRKFAPHRYVYIIFLFCYVAFYLVRMILFFPEGLAPMVFEEESLAGIIKNALKI